MSCSYSLIVLRCKNTIQMLKSKDGGVIVVNFTRKSAFSRISLEKAVKTPLCALIFLKKHPKICEIREICELSELLTKSAKSASLSKLREKLSAKSASFSNLG